MASNPLKNMSLYAVSLFLMKGISLFTLPLMAHYLSPAQLGQLEFIGITAVFFSMVIGLAMHENLYRFIGTIDCHDTQKRKASELYTATLLISSGLGIACFTLYNLIGAPIESISESQSFLIGIVLCYEAPLAIGLAWLRLHNQAMLFFKLCITTVIVQVALLVMILFYRPDVTLIFAANVICTLGQFLFLHVYLPFSIRLPSREQLQSYLRYSSPLMLSAMVAFALSGAETLVYRGLYRSRNTWHLRHRSKVCSRRGHHDSTLSHVVDAKTISGTTNSRQFGGRKNHSTGRAVALCGCCGFILGEPVVYHASAASKLSSSSTIGRDYYYGYGVQRAY